jgi:aldose 1-epimerase
VTDTEWTLRSGDLRATVSPTGASLRRLWVETPFQPDRDLVWGYTDAATKKGGQGDVLIPFPGRVAGGTYSFEGRRHELARNDKEGPNAIHGFVRSKEWEGAHDASSAQFRTQVAADDHAGYPFDLDVVVGYELLPTGLACAFVALNIGTGPAPFGAGFHPYLLGAATADDTDLQVPARHVVEFDGRLLPTGRLLDVPPELDFRARRRVGPAALNHCLTGLAADPDGFTRIRAGGVELWMDRSFPYVVLYTGDGLGPHARKALAVEPMTCATDAFNHPEWGLRVLQPGEAMSGTWGIALRNQATPT